MKKPDLDCLLYAGVQTLAVAAITQIYPAKGDLRMGSHKDVFHIYAMIGLEGEPISLRIGN